MSLYKFTHIKNEPNQNKKVANNQPKKKRKKKGQSPKFMKK